MDKTVYEVLEEVVATQSKNSKESILKQNASNDTLKEVFRLTYSPTIKYYINNKTFPRDWEPCESSVSWEEVFHSGDYWTSSYTGIIFILENSE